MTGSKFQSGVYLLVVIFCLSGCGVSLAGQDDNIKKSFQVEPGGHLTLDVQFGSIEVSPSEGKEVNIEVIRKVKTSDPKKAEEILKSHQVDFKQAGNDVMVKSGDRARAFGKGSWDHLEVRYVISVPKKFNVDLNTSGGSITVNDLEGEAIAKTSGGSLHFGNIQGPVSGKTSGGGITVLECTGKVDINTSGGSITLGKIAGPLLAQTSGGSIRIDEVRGDVKASTSGGSIQASISRQPASDSELGTSGGSIHIKLKPDLNLNLVAKASGGDIQSDIPLMVQGAMSRSSLQGKMNAGGPQLYLHSSGGSVHISKLQ